METWDPLGGKLIFVISPPRSGTTLLQKMLASHSQIHTVSEPWIALQPLLALRPRAFAAFYNANVAQDGVLEFLRVLPEGEEAYWQAVRLMLGHLYSRALDGSGKRYFLDKTPRYFHIVPELRRVFPRARFVTMARNPVAVLSSVLENWVRSESAGALREFGADLLLGPRRVWEAAQSGTDVFLRYEDLAAGPDTVMRQVCTGIGVDFEDQVLDYGRSDAGRTVFRYGDAHTVYQHSRPVAERVDRWRGVISASPVWTNWAHGYVNALGRDLLTGLGYDIDALLAQIGEAPEVTVPWADAIAPG